MSSVVLVTGGAGFVGAAVVRALVRHGAEVHVSCRARTNRAGLSGIPLTWHVAELAHETELARAFAAAAAAARARSWPLDVVHLAARISYRRADRELLRQANVEGTRHVLAAAARAGVRRFCHVSSVVALGSVADVEQELDDEAPLGGLQLDSAYARTKAEAEQLALAASRERDVVIASPAVVFGLASAGSNSTHFLGRVARGTLGPLTPPGSLSVVGLDDTAEGIRRVLERGVRGRRYLLAESAWRLHDLLGLACRLAGRSPPRACVPRPLWRLLVGAAALADRFAPSERITPEALALLGLHFRFRAARARAELGWTPRPIAEVLAEILQALAAEERA
ncbi:MAG: NAD-dependent epimerase/dehydratase family protein [Planctomycetes bacterium]|nr:NAD-dependent epimerase/dehydratase family protein [Planctomycetota bacterium]